MIITDKKYFLQVIIKKLRAEMIRIGISEGLSSENTIKISQRLDAYIVKYQNLMSNKKCC